MGHWLFGETPNRATGTVALPFSNWIVPTPMLSAFVFAVSVLGLR
jgi:hypothetical protein